MSTKLTGYVWDGCAASGMKLSSVAIMARLADFSNDEGVCWPSIETIARQIGAGMSTVRTAIARLEAEGWLTRKARRQGNSAQAAADSQTASANSATAAKNQKPTRKIARQQQRAAKQTLKPAKLMLNPVKQTRRNLRRTHLIIATRRN